MMKVVLTILTVFTSAASLLAQIPSVAWTSSLGSTYSDAGHFIHQLPDKSFFLAATSNFANGQLGNTTGPANGEVVFIGLDSLGQMQWGNRIGGPGHVSISHGALMADGNYVFTGTIYQAEQEVPDSYGDDDLWIVKVTPTGSIVWERSYGLVGQNDKGLHVARRPGGGCFVSGQRGLEGWDAWVIVLDNDGNEVWARTYGGSSVDIGRSIVATADGGALLAAWTGSNNGDVSTPLHGVYDGWLVKLDANGEIEWDRTYGGSGVNQFNDIIRLPDGGFLVLGSSNSSNGDVPENNGDWDIWLLRLDGSGEIIWSHSYGGSATDYGSEVVLYQGNYLVVGGTGSADGDVTVSYNLPTNGAPHGEDGWLLMVHPSGQLLWERSVGGSKADGLHALALTDNGFVATGSSMSADHFVPSNVAFQDIWTVRINTKSTSLTGTLYVDADNDASISIDDPRIVGRLVELANNGELALSQPNGRYSFGVSGPAQLTVTGPDIPHFSRDPGTHATTIGSDQPAVSGVDFRYTAETSAQDLQVFITPISPFRPGFPVRYDVLCRNVGTSVTDASISVMLDDGLTLDSASTAPGTVVGNTVTWPLGPMHPLQNIALTVYCTQSVADTLGSPVTTTAEILPLAGDLVPQDNSVTANDQVVGSFDPNDILVDPAEILTEDVVDASLDYIIRFQNTGTDTAFTVAIENPLPAHAHLSSFEVIGSSHPMTLMYYDFDRKMRFQFNHILLPDSNTNELLSHGYVRYRLKPQPYLTAGDTIRNVAAIFFDHNAPVITNTATTAIIEPNVPTGELSHIDQVQFTLFPNPVNAALTICTPEDLRGAELLLRDALGRIVLAGRITTAAQVVDLSRFGAGLYHLSLRHMGVVNGRTLIKE